MCLVNIPTDVSSQDFSPVTCFFHLSYFLYYNRVELAYHTHEVESLGTAANVNWGGGGGGG